MITIYKWQMKEKIDKGNKDKSSYNKKGDNQIY